ncbi:hypothetical protein [Verrucomicrobium spinosum]|uniref:hypothetical protein n=1 Tax=Verrucomicrobium spinosum TaxID=2736 RepID=UPI000B14CCF3|nr:hypothetical protein [Verrucomicrobium spinosum]
MKRFHEAVADDPAVSFDTFYGQAVDLIGSQPAQEPSTFSVRTRRRVISMAATTWASRCCSPGGW